MVHEYALRVLPQVAADERELKAYIALQQGWGEQEIQAVRLLKKSIDARGRQVVVNLQVRVFVGEPAPALRWDEGRYQDVSKAATVLVVGAGPAGLFAALRLIELGCKPVVLERGKNVHERKRDLAQLSRSHLVHPDSNYCFGEGGAGAYSDGKLYTRSKKKGNVERILRLFCQHGANPNILTDVHPHIGTDKLPQVISAIRERILACGGEVHFQTKATSLLLVNDKIAGTRVEGVETDSGQCFHGPVILATGHSARDVYAFLHRQQVRMDAKGIAVGVRLEHPQTLIDCIQYHSPYGRGAWLPAAEYSFVTQVNERGVYSFCMCPGGFVVPAATGPEQVVVNGMSPSGRSGKWANSGMVVEIRPEDVSRHPSDLFAVLRFQEQLERRAWELAGRSQTAPAQRMEDFMRQRCSSTLPKSSYLPGLVSVDMHQVLPSAVETRLREGFRRFGSWSHGFITNEACLIGVETRTSAPLRIVRDAVRLHHLTVQGLYPAGEGAGYAGGIVSAAIDGERCAECCAAQYPSFSGGGSRL